jgi:uncharacterized protein (TIGR02391 family)
MKEKSIEILKYMHRHMTENNVRQFTFMELPSKSGLNHLANNGYITVKNVGTTNAYAVMTTKGIDWIAQNLSDETFSIKPIVSAAKLQGGSVTLTIHPDIYSHVKGYLDSGHNFNAVEEAYKYVREKLKGITGEEKATEIFNMNAENTRYHEQIFGKKAEAGTPESDFFRGVGYLNLAIQFLRNEKSHTLATTLDKNLAIHYISLASLAYDLISRGKGYNEN